MRRLVVVCGLLFSASWSSAQSAGGLGGQGANLFAGALPSAAEVAAGVRGAGTLAARVLPRVVGAVSWAGLIAIGPELINQGLTYFYNELKAQSGNAELDAFEGSKTPATGFQLPIDTAYTDHGYSTTWTGIAFLCNRDGHSWFTGSRTLNAYNQTQGVVVSDDASIVNVGNVNGPPPAFDCGATTLDAIIDHPGVGDAVSRAIGRLITDHPERVIPTFTYSPVPTPNQLAGAIVGPGDSNGDGVDDRAAAAVGKDAGDPAKPVTAADLHTVSTATEPGGAVTVTRRDVSPIDGHVTTAGNTFTPGTSPATMTTSTIGGTTTTTSTTTSTSSTGAVTTTSITSSVTATDNPSTGGKTETTVTTTTTGTTANPTTGAPATTNTDTKTTTREIPKAAEEPKTCAQGDASCTPKPADCPAGQVKGSDGVCRVPDPGNGCNDFSIARFLAYPFNWIKDLFVPCSEVGDLIQPLIDATKDKFPFSMTTRLNNMVSASGSPDRAAVLPGKIGPFVMDWSWITTLVFTVGLLFKAFISYLAIDFLLSKLSGQIVMK